MASFDAPISSSQYDSLHYKRSWDNQQRDSNYHPNYKLQTVSSSIANLSRNQFPTSQAPSDAPMNPATLELEQIVANNPEIARNHQYRRLYVTNFVNLEAATLRRIFKSFGQIEEVEFHAKDGKPFCFIQFQKIQSVYDALSVMNCYKIENRPLRVHLPSSIKSILPNYNPKLWATSQSVQSGWIYALQEGHSLGLIQDQDMQILSTLFSNPMVTSSSNGLGVTGSMGGGATGMQTDQMLANPLQHPYKLYVGNIPLEYGESELLQLFSEYAPLHIHLIANHATGTHKGYCFIDVQSAEIVAAAVAEMHGQEIKGQRLQVSSAKSHSSVTALTDSNVPMKTVLIDLNELDMPDPLSIYYPDIIPDRKFPIPSTIVCIQDLLTVEQFNSPQFQNEERIQFLTDLDDFMRQYGAIEQTNFCVRSVRDLPFRPLDLTTAPTSRRGRSDQSAHDHDDDEPPTDNQTNEPTERRPAQRSLSPLSKKKLLSTPYTVQLKDEVQNAPFVDKVCAFIRFTSTLEARRAFLCIQNQLFDGHPVPVHYALNMG